MEMNRKEKIERLQGLQKSLELCTRPCKGHTDPLSINDCWNWMRELLNEIKDEDEKLLLRAEQFKREQKSILELPGRTDSYENSFVLVGVSRMVDFIKRHLGVTDKAEITPNP